MRGTTEHAQTSVLCNYQKPLQGLKFLFKFQNLPLFLSRTHTHTYTHTKEHSVAILCTSDSPVPQAATATTHNLKTVTRIPSARFENAIPAVEELQPTP